MSSVDRGSRITESEIQYSVDQLEKSGKAFLASKFSKRSMLSRILEGLFQSGKPRRIIFISVRFPA
jgi:hypothetical protein